MARILINGSNRGIGAALAAEAESRGHAVLRATRTGQGGDVIFDFSDPMQVKHAILAINQPIDVVINNAGIIGPDSPTTDIDWTAMTHTFAVNVTGALDVSTACLNNLPRSTSPRILTILSQMAYMGYAKSDCISYRASKAAVNKVMQGLATDLYPNGISVVLVDLGWVQTDMGGAEAELDPKEVATGINNLAEGITLEDTGKFFRWSGEERAF